MRENTRRALLLSPALLTLGLLMLAPMGVIVVYSLLESGAYGGVEWRASGAAYEQFLFERDFLEPERAAFSPDYLIIFARSAWRAALATVACLLLGFPAAYYIATRPPRVRLTLLFLITVPYWVNLLIRTLAMLFLIRDEGPLNHALTSLGILDAPMRIAYTGFAVTLGLFYSYLPFMILPIYAALERFDFGLAEAARDLYAGRIATLLRIVAPVAAPGIAAGCALVFIPSLGSFIAPDLLGGGKEMMIGNLIAQQFQGSRNWPFGAAAAVILTALVLLALALMARGRARTALGGGHAL